jgi:competence protein ComEA
MPELSRPPLFAGVLLAVLVAALGVRYVHGRAANEGAPAAVSAAGAGSASVRVERRAARPALVHVAGAVRHPGVFRLADGARVEDAVRRAGGPRRGADVNAINLAAKVADGQQVIVPRRVAGVAPAAAVSAGGGAAAAQPPAPVNLNTATAEQLDTLDGVGPATAAKILAWRTQHGGFRSVDDLGQVPGIGPKRLAALRPRVQA